MTASQEMQLRIGTPMRPERVTSSPCGEGKRRLGTEVAFLAVATLAIIAFATVAIAQTAEVVFDLSIEKGRVAANMRLIRVRQGDAVRLRWTTDRPILLHLHGYDIETKVEPGAITEMAFAARATGRFPIEEHRPNAQGGHSHGEAPLVRIEVYPR
jgi:hypothetical protein